MDESFNLISLINYIAYAILIQLKISFIQVYSQRYLFNFLHLKNSYTYHYLGLEFLTFNY